MRLQIHVAVDPKKTPLEEIAEIKTEAVKESMLSVHAWVRQLTMDLASDPMRKDPRTPPAWQQWTSNQDGTRATIVNPTEHLKWLMHGNHANNPDGYIHPLGNKPFRFKRRDTGEWVRTWKVHPIDPNRIWRTVPIPYSFRRDVVEEAMWKGSEHAMNVLEGREDWRGVLQVRLTRL